MIGSLPLFTPSASYPSGNQNIQPNGSFTLTANYDTGAVFSVQAGVLAEAPKGSVSANELMWLNPGGGSVNIYATDGKTYCYQYDGRVAWMIASYLLTNTGAPAFKIAPRTWRGNMCGIRIPGLPAVPGGASDPELFLSWFFDRYSPEWQAVILAAAKAHGWQDWLTSWPDSRAFGQSPDQFRATQIQLMNAGFIPCPMLYSKDYDPTDFAGIQANIQQVLPFLVGLVARACVGWELSIALSPTVVQQLIDWLSPQFIPTGAKLYVHFQKGYYSFQQPGQPTAAFWITNVGKLTGVLRQRNPDEDLGVMSEYQARIADVLDRFAGQDGCPSDSGFNHPFDDIELEITADEQFNPPYMSESDGNAWGQAALATPAVNGPLGPVFVMGSGNGQ